MARHPKLDNPFRWFDSSPEVIQMVVMLYVRFPLSLRNVEDLAFERGIDICHETVRLWWDRFGPMLAGRNPQPADRWPNQSCSARVHLQAPYSKSPGDLSTIRSMISRVLRSLTLIGLSIWADMASSTR